MNVRCVLPSILLSTTLGGCGLFGAKEESPPPPPPTRVELKIDAAGDLNPDGEGHASPLLLRVYELKEISAFNSADFFALYDKEQAVLAGDLARKREFLLKPGEKQTLNLEPAADTRFVALFAAFRRLDTAQWRASSPIVAQKTTMLEAKVQGTALTLRAVDSEPAKPAKPKE